MLTKSLIIVLTVLLLPACKTLEAINVLNDAKCTTEIATKDSKFTCEFEGKKILGKKQEVE